MILFHTHWDEIEALSSDHQFGNVYKDKIMAVK